MFEYIYTILQSKHPNVFLFKLLILLTIFYVLFFLYKHFYRNDHKEGFTQNERFVLKQNDNIYDNFYSQIHDEIHKPKHRIDFELIQIIHLTEPTKKSIFLDIGSGTGDVVHELQDAGYIAYGLDKSQSMIDVAESKFPKSQYKCGDTMDPILFEKGSFTHILCTYFTIYHFNDKRTFLYNCYHWLMPNGYLILHLADREKFDTIIPAQKTNLYVNPNRSNTGSRITESVVEFPDFEYKCSYQFKHNSNNVYMTETFKDIQTSNVRQNEQILYMENMEDILHMAKNVGFIIKGSVNMKDCNDDENQYIYILEKI